MYIHPDVVHVIEDAVPAPRNVKLAEGFTYLVAEEPILGAKVPNKLINNRISCEKKRWKLIKAVHVFPTPGFPCRGW